VTLPPLILDTGVLAEPVRGDLNLMEMVAHSSGFDTITPKAMAPPPSTA
jgi:hypothetical protein